MKDLEFVDIEFIDYGIAYYSLRVSKPLIQLNVNLLKHPKLLMMVMDHEVEHYLSKNLLHDFFIDFKDSFNLRKQLLLSMFILKYPKSIISSSPIIVEKNKVYFNYFLVAQYLTIIFIILIILWVIL